MLGFEDYLADPAYGSEASFLFYSATDVFLFRRCVRAVLKHEGREVDCLVEFRGQNGAVAARAYLSARAICEIVLRYPELAEAARWDFDCLMRHNPWLASEVKFPELVRDPFLALLPYVLPSLDLDNSFLCQEDARRLELRNLGQPDRTAPNPSHPMKLYALRRTYEAQSAKIKIELAKLLKDDGYEFDVALQRLSWVQCALERRRTRDGRVAGSSEDVVAALKIVPSIKDLGPMVLSKMAAPPQETHKRAGVQAPC